MIRLSRFVAALSVAAMLAAPLAAFAQPAPAAAPPAAGATAPAHKHHHRSAYMHALRSLTLSDSQRQQIKSLMQTARTNARATTDPATRRANTKQLRTQIDAILTPAQRTQLKSAVQSARANPKPAGT